MVPLIIRAHVGNWLLAKPVPFIFRAKHSSKLLHFQKDINGIKHKPEVQKVSYPTDLLHLDRSSSLRRFPKFAVNVGLVPLLGAVLAVRRVNRLCAFPTGRDPHNVPRNLLPGREEHARMLKQALRIVASFMVTPYSVKVSGGSLLSPKGAFERISAGERK